jgi:DNA-binding CsgD family transcriptional regulator
MHPRLSARQEQCLRLTAFRTDKEIAAHLGISEATVKKHVHEACQRLGVNRRKAALALMDPIVPERRKASSSTGAAAGYPKHPMARRTPDHHAVRDREQDIDEGDGQGGAAGSPRLPEGDRTGPVPMDGRGLLSGHAGRDNRPEHGRLGYRLPPGNPFLRAVLIVGLTIVIAALVVTLVTMLGDMHEAVGRIDAASAAGQT